MGGGRSLGWGWVCFGCGWENKNYVKASIILARVCALNADEV